MKLLVTLVACLAVVASVNAQSCPLTPQEANKIDYSGISPACAGVSSSPSFAACDSCTAAFTKAFSPYYAQFGVTCDNIPTDPSAGTSALSSTLTPCVNVLQGPLQKAGVNLLQLVNLRSCPTDKGYGPQLTAAIQARCPNWKPAPAASG